MSVSTKPGKGFCVIAVLALLWELMGVVSFLLQDRMATTEAQIALQAQSPAWINLLYALAVFSGALGALLLVMRRRAAALLFLLSFIAAALQFGGVFAFTDALALLGGSSVVFPVIVVLVGIALWLYARRCASRGWLR